MGRKGTYLFKRKGSQNWWLRFQYGLNGAKKERSLGTPDRAEAEVLAAEDIRMHRLGVFQDDRQRRGISTSTIKLRFEPGRMHVTEDGTRILATKEKLFYLNDDDSISKEEPNLGKMVLVEFKNKSDELAIRQLIPPSNIKSPNSEIIDTWIQHRNLNKHISNEAKNVWNIFRSITDNKDLKRCTRDDGRKLVKHLYEIGNKTQTIDKKISHLRAAVNLAIDEGKLTFNPFSNIIPRKDDGVIRLPLSEPEMAKVRENLSTLSHTDQLLWKLLATTGMRLQEPFEIQDERDENGLRYVTIGTKTASSRRHIPLPDAVAELLPNKIEHRLFKDGPETTAKRLRYFLRRLNISYDAAKGTGDQRKVIHSLRHRAKDRLRASGCPLDIQYHILGHEVKTVASGYGTGYPLDQIKRWIETIGY